MGIPHPSLSSRLRAAAVTVVTLVVASALLAVQPAAADTAPPVSTTPETVSTDALDTVQLNGVVWDQVIVGNTVYVAGNFTTARPSGSAAGANTVARTHLLSFNLTTGALLPWAPTVNAQARSIAASPDGTRLYVGGDFTTVNGVAKNRIAAFDIASGNLVSAFQASANSPVYAVTATNSTVFFGGQFTQARSVTRSYAAAADAATGTTNAFAPIVAGGRIFDMVVSPDGTKVVIGGAFTTVNGSDNPGYGLAMLNATTGATLPTGVNSLVRNGGKDAAIFSLNSDGDSFYGTGYHFGPGGSLEGPFRASWATGDLIWVADCHGDTYSVAAANGVVYTASHAHYCGNVGDKPQTDPDWDFNRGMAFSKAATGVNGADPYGYFNWNGVARPDVMNFYPTINSGTFTGQYQGAWSVVANSQYTVFGGEFTNVNGKAQQGLVRMAVKTIAPNLDGPRLTGANFVPTVDSPAAGTVRVSWDANWDRDNEQLTYQVLRGSTVVYTTTRLSRFWDRPNISFVDTTATPGQSYTYRIRAIDPFNNQVQGSPVTITAATGGTLSGYAKAVIADQPTSFWRLGDSAGATTALDSAGQDTTPRVGAGVTFGATGAIAGDPTTAATFSGDGGGLVASNKKVWRDDTFTIEAWVKTTSTSGGKIVGFGNSNTGESNNYDRHVYMTPSGKLSFGVYPGSSQIIQSSQSYNDGQWHHVVATLGSNGMQLYVDAKRVAKNAAVSNGQQYWGYWRVGGDSSWDGNPYFAGQIDDVAIYPAAISQERIQQHYTLAGGTVTTQPAPTDAYGAAVYAQDPSFFWRLGETSGTTATDVGQQSANGVYSGTYALGTSSPVRGADANAVKFTEGVVAASAAVNNPTVYSTEIWFSTTTNRGGKLTGFGNQQSGLSSGYDRHVYMQDDGRLVFGTWTGFENTVTSSASYNDGAWHQVVATQGSDGMKLYVDGQLVGTNGQTGAEGSSGYWRAGGDVTWGSSSPWFDGQLDEFAVYDKVLGPAVIAGHYDLGKPAAANVAPTASFTSTVTGLSAAFDASASSDTDGSVVSYAWNFGDSTTGTGVSPSHAYAAAGTYTVTLTVTDDDAAIATTTGILTVTVPNVAPSASFETSAVNLSVGVNAAGSNDPDGSIAGYAWTFGDGGTATGATASHSYAAAGTYTIRLTVTDDQGATGTTTRSVTVSPANVAPSASFTTAVTNLTVAVNGSGSSDTDGTVAGYAWNFGDGATATGATASHAYAAAGTFTVTLVVTDDKGATDTTTRTVTVSAAANVAPTASFTAVDGSTTVTFDASASADPDGTIASYAWSFGDGTTGTGRNVSHTYPAATDYTVTLTVTDNAGATATASKQVWTWPSHLPPTAAFTVSASGLTATVDGSGSADPDGAIASWTWAWGDGTAATTTTVPTASHAYATAGTYTVTLTVADAAGQTATTTRTVTVATPPTSSTLASDTFTRTSTAGWGSATTGGAWNTPANASYVVNNGSGALSHTAGTTRHTNLTAVSTSDVDITTKIAMDKVATGGGAYAGVVGRQVGTEFYQVRTRFFAGNTVGVQVLRGSSTVLANVNTIPGLTYSAGAQLNMRVQTTGVSPTTIRAKVWAVGAAEPTAWTITTTDATAALQAAGSIGVESYLSGSATNAPVVVRYDDFLAGSGTVVTPPANVAPTAAFTATPTDLTVAVNASASTDADGTIASYAWNFGDGTTGTGVTASRAYAAAGTYQVTLTVTDNSGAATALTKPVTVTAPVVTPPTGNTIATDAFGRTTTAGWGSADLGGAWNAAANTSYLVNAGTGAMSHPVGGTRRALLTSVSETNVDVTASFASDKAAAGGNIVVGLVGRQVGSDFYQGRARLLPDGTVAVQLLRGSGTLLANATVPGLTYSAGQVLRIRVQVTGTAPTTIKAKVWADGTTEPTAWQLTTTDSTAALQAAGSVGVESYLSGSASNAPVVVRYDDFVVTRVV